ncbi:hypothetical protein [Kitasatospora sp. NBC_01266]|nr:hypothetical protein [Kitasatospora sp. NBC_01266]
MRLCKILHGPPSTWEDRPADELDWLIAVDDTQAQARANLEKEAAGG